MFDVPAIVSFAVPMPSGLPGAADGLATIRVPAASTATAVPTTLKYPLVMKASLNESVRHLEGQRVCRGALARFAGVFTGFPGRSCLERGLFRSRGKFPHA